MTELRWLVTISSLLLAILTLARLLEVSTRPFISVDMAATPWGRAMSRSQILAAVGHGQRALAHGLELELEA